MDTQAPIRRAGRATPYLFLAPYLVLFGVFVVLPGLYGLWISLHDWDFLLGRAAQLPEPLLSRVA